MTDHALATLGSLALAAGGAGLGWLSNILPEGGVVGEMAAALAGTLVGGAIVVKVSIAVLEARVQALLEGQRDLWKAIKELRDADGNHLERFHTHPDGRRRW